MRWQKSELLCAALVIGLPLFTYPLSWLPAGSTGFRFNLTLALTILSFLVVLFAIAHTFSRCDAIQLPRTLLMPSLVLAASWLLSVRFSQQPSYSVRALPGWASLMAILFVASQSRDEALSKLGWAWLIAAILVALNGLVRWRDPEFLSTIGNRNFAGSYLAASVVVGIGLQDRRAMVACAVLLGAMIFTQSRGAWVALGLVGSIWFVLARTSGRISRSIVVVLVGMALAWLSRGYVKQQWLTDVRPSIWRATLAMGREHWLLGHGLGTFAINYPKFRSPEYFRLPKAANLTDHAHNELLEIFAEQGLLGLTATLWLWLAALRLGWKRSRAGLLAATVVFLVHSMVDVDLRHPPNEALSWLLLGLLASGSKHQLYRIQFRHAVTRFAMAVGCVVIASAIGWAFVVQPIRADIWERRARLAETQGDFVQAASAADQALRLQPLRLGTRYFLAGVLAKTPTAQARARAIEESLKIEELAPDYSDITFNLSQLYLADGRYGEALVYLQRAVAIDPYNAGKRVVLAFALGELGQISAACEQLREALKLDPRNADAHTLLAQYERRLSS